MRALSRARLPRLAADPHAQLGLLMLAGALVFLAKIWQGPLGGDEACYALLAREILRSGDWTVLHHPAVPEWANFYEHPPLYMWATALFYEFISVGDTAAKLFSALSGWATLVAVTFTARRIGGHRFAMLAGSLVVTALYFVDYARKARLEVPLAFFVFLAFALAVRAVKERSRASLLLAGVATALAALTKGVPAAAAALIVVALVLIEPGDRWTWREKLRGLALYALGAAILLLPWVWLQLAVDDGRFFEWYSQRQVAWSVQGRPDAGGVLPQAGSALFYVKKLFTEVMVPGALLAAGGVFVLARRRHWREDRVLWTAAFAVVVIVGAFASVPFHKARYLLPAVPFLALLAAFFLQQLGFGDRSERAMLGLLAVIVAAGLLLLPFGGVHFYTKKDGAFLPLVGEVQATLAPTDTLLVGGMRPYTAQQVFTWYFDRPLRISSSQAEFEARWRSGRYRAAVARDFGISSSSRTAGPYQLLSAMSGQEESKP